ncbi:hypothetical protein M422DRAFT_24818 [Sphaerobolus stellatus SS14]|nr:hypothetical protein M422DRAFT_24818 [Sphaerobolus stellatus SS14]
MSTTDFPLLDVLARTLQEFVNIRYVTASVYICLLLEHLHSLPQEIEYIWNAPINFAGILFLVFRYSTLGGMTLLTHTTAGLAGTFSDQVCKHAIGSLSALSITTIAVADIIVLLRVSVLWGRHCFILGLMSISFLLTYSVVIVFTIIGAKELVEFTSFIRTPAGGACVPLIKPYSILGVWIPGVAFDFLVLLLTTWNACARPRTKETALARTLYRDGIAFFVILAGLRLLNLFMTLFSKSFLVGVCISWPLVAITLSRFLFHVREVEKYPHDLNGTRNHSTDSDDKNMDHELGTTDVKGSLPTSFEAATTLRHSDHSENPSCALNMWEIVEARTVETHDHIRSSSQSWIERHSVRSASIRSYSSSNKV